MIHALQNSFYKLVVQPQRALWGLSGTDQASPALMDIHMGVYYRTRYQSMTGLRPGTSLAVESQKTVSSPHGPLRQMELVSDPDKYGMSFWVTFALAEKEPLMFCKMKVENGGNQPVYLDRLEFLNAGFIYIAHASFPLMKYSGYGAASDLQKGSIRLSREMGEPAFFSNGWQSWSYTGVYGLSDRFRRTRLGPLTAPMRVNAGTPHHKRMGLYSSDMFGVLGDRVNRRGILVGFLSQSEQFGSVEALLDPFEPALRVWANGDGVRLDPGKQMDTDWLCVLFLHLDTPDPIGLYLEAAARQNQVSVNAGTVTREGRPGIPAGKSRIGIPTGWCSWYHYFKKVTYQDIRYNLEAAQSLRGRIPLELIQIDDGFEAQMGDWLEPSPQFPQGLQPLSKDITAAGFIPGLWLAPFTLTRKSRLAREHPAWLLRNRYGLAVNAGYLWDAFITALDLTHPEALEYVRQVVKTAVYEWGYPFLKLDFLYAGALPGRHQDASKTRAQVLRQALLAVREAAGEENYLLGCGCPLGSGLGIFDSMRIGSDVDTRWYPTFKGIRFYFQDEPDIPSVRNALHNVLTRAPLHKRWWINDPDCLILRPETELTSAEVQSMATVVALSGGSLTLSDDLSRLPSQRLKIAEALFPLIGKAPYVLDWFDSSTPTRIQLNLEGPLGKWHLIGLFNWGEQPLELEVNLNDLYIDTSKTYWVRSFWDGKIYQTQAGGPDPLKLEKVPPHGSILLSLQTYIKGVPQYVGSDLHISQGLEVTTWEWAAGPLTPAKDKIAGRLAFSLERPGLADGHIYLALPDKPRQVVSNGLPLPWNCESGGIYSLDVEFNRRIDIEIYI